MKKEKVIFHIDADSFFVSAVVSIRPELKNKEVAVSSHKNFSIVSSLSYEAKKKGAKVPMKLFEVKKFCPNIITVLPNYDLFSILSNKIFAYLAKNFSTKIEVLSIDECFLDVTDIVYKYKNILHLAKKIQNEIYEHIKIPVSIGISYNNFFAKMASPLAKPFGIKIIDKSNFKEILYPLKISKFYGIGKSSIKKLNDYNIFLIGDLLDSSKEKYFINIFKNRWFEIKNNLLGNGIDYLNFEHNDVKSLGKEKTFYNKTTDDRKEIFQILKQLCDIVSHNLRNRFNLGYVISIKIKYEDKSIVSAQKTLDFPINSSEDIFENASILFDKTWSEYPIKLIGVSLSKLINSFENNSQISLFFKKEKLNPRIEGILNDLNANFETRVLYKASDFPKKSKSVQSRFSPEDRHKK